jgi:LysM repeat protein
MSPIRKKGFPGTQRAYHPPKAAIIPEPPECNGFMYMVERNDSIYSVAKKFNCTVKQLLSANPQIGHRSGTIFIRQRLCIPDVVDLLPETKLLPVGPKVLFVEFLDAMGNPPPVSNGFTHLHPRTFIRVIFNQPVTTVYFFFVPSRKLILRPSFLIGVETVFPAQRSVRFTWDVPRGIRGSLFIIGCNQTICGPPNELLVTRR